MSIQGVDISGDFQDVTSFHDLHNSGVGFVVVKATQGTGFSAGRFGEYRTRIAEIPGLTFGAYHFIEWAVDAAAQAAHFLSVYKPKNGDLVMLDCEAFPHQAEWSSASAEQQAQWRAENTATIQGWLDAVRPHLGDSLPLVYASYSAVGTFFDPTGFAGHPFWIAAYENPDAGFGDIIPSALAGKSPGVVIWQYSDGGGTNPPGITATSTDRDVFNGDEAALQALTIHGL
jgi:GH25 family lysozyme M1 (1,4-beta-N-acetylmuramidase)